MPTILQIGLDLAILVCLLAILVMRILRPTRLDTKELERKLDEIVQSQEKVERLVHEEADAIRQAALASSKQDREELQTVLKGIWDSMHKQMVSLGELQRNHLDGLTKQLGELTQSNENKLETIRSVVSQQLTSLREDNGKHLDQMRATVDEKLQGTLEKRLGESFKLVSDRLEEVHKGLGEMQTLATGVGDLKRVLTNVKTRGTWGEIQLEGILQQLLSPDQFQRNVKPNPATEAVVEFAIRLPGRGGPSEDAVWLPIDSKFPTEDYLRLVEAQEQADPEAAAEASKALAARIRASAKDISDKYIAPPHTTDFGVMYLASEGLYAEVVRRPDLVESIQRDYRVVLAGPTTFAALLNSLQVGFQTLAIQERSSEVWRLLGAVKTEFGKFGDVLDGVRKKLDQASKKMDSAARRSRAIERKLRTVEELPAGESSKVLAGNGDAHVLDENLLGEEVV